MLSATLIAQIITGLLFLYFALRVMQMKRASMSFLVAYPLFVLILVGGGIAVFIGMSWVVVLLQFPREAALATIYAVTGLSLLGLWWVARRAIG